MNKELKKKWKLALKSGEYKQAFKRLYSEEEDSYCCIGLLCKLAGKEVPDKGEGDNSEGLNEPLYAWAEEQLGDDKLNLLMKMNDNLFSFEEIALVI